MAAFNIVTDAIGEIGCWQYWLILLIFLSKFSTGWNQIVVVIVAPPPGNFSCADPALDKCDPHCTEYVYDHSIWEKTIIYEWNLVCIREYIASTVQSIVMAGILVGSLLFGYLSDRFGRRIPLMIAILIQLVAGLVAAFSPYLWLYTLMRFLSTVGTGGTMPVTFVILMEFIGAKYRTSLGILYQLPFHIGHASLGLIGYLWRRWDYIQLAITLPTGILIFYWCLLPESPRWLLTMGKSERVINLLERIAKCNHMPTEQIRSNIESHLQNTASVKQSSGGNVLTLVKTKKMRIKTLVMFFNWFSVAMAFFAIAQYISQLGGNIFINVAAPGLVQIPGNLIAVYIISKFGRKCSLITSNIICFVPMYIMSVLPQEPTWPSQVMGCISMMGIAMSFCIIYVYSGELFPTVVRTVAVGLSSVCARFGSMTSPYLMHLKMFGDWLPPLALGLFPMISCIVTYFFLPETMDIPLPDTVEEADNL